MLGKVNVPCERCWVEWLWRLIQEWNKVIPLCRKLPPAAHPSYWITLLTALFDDANIVRLLALHFDDTIFTIVFHQHPRIICQLIDPCILRPIRIDSLQLYSKAHLARHQAFAGIRHLVARKLL